MAKKILIRESQFKMLIENIASKKLMNESPGDKIDIEVGTLFNSGEYQIKEADKIEEMKKNLKEVADFIKKNNGFIVEIKINAGESQVPNPSGMKVGDLAKRRATVMEKILTQGLKTLGINEGLFEIKQETIIGKTLWDPNKGRDHIDYKNEQFVNLEILATARQSMASVDSKGIESKPEPRELNIKIDTESFNKDKANLHINFNQSKTEYYAGTETIAMENIQKLADYLKENPNVKVQIEGHTSGESMSSEKELKLSQDRAEKVNKELIKMGVKRNQLEKPIGYGMKEVTEWKRRNRNLPNDQYTKLINDDKKLREFRRVMAKFIR